MMEHLTGPLYLALFTFLVLISSSLANKYEDDDYKYWLRREQQAQKIAQSSYVPDPFTITNSFNHAVNVALKKKYTGRSLKPSYAGACQATNPIDRCWRCNPNWASNRQKLASCAKGFGRKAWGGGKHGKIYVVTDPSDDYLILPKEGTLRHAVTRNESLWIVFDRDMTITLSQELIIAENKTVDGRGADVHIAYGAGLTIQFVSNVIVHGIHVHDIVPESGGIIRDSWDHVGFRGRSDGDGVSIFGASNIWLDHLTLSNCRDGLIDAIQGSTAITISNSYFTNHDDVMLLGASDAYSNDTIMQVTVAFNHFGEGLVQRMPRVRWGFAHVVNNDYTHWIMYAVGGSMHPTIVSQGNRFIAPDNPYAKEITKRDYADYSVWKNWNWTSEGDLYLNGAFFNASGVRNSYVLRKDFTRHDVFKAKPGSFVTRLTRYAGALDCKVGKPC